jgi:hypothetical protein
METVFSVGPAPRLYNEDRRPAEIIEFRDADLPGCELGSRGIERVQVRL